MIRTTLFALALTTSAAAFAQAGAIQSIPRAKVVANAEAEFKEVDANKDGQMTRAEIETFQLNSIMAAAAARNKAMFGELDTDKNGQLSATEFARLSSGKPKVDASGVLSIDTNKDGKISTEEYRAPMLAMFNSVDSNKDGTISAQERSQAQAKRTNQRKK